MNITVIHFWRICDVYVNNYISSIICKFNQTNYDKSILVTVNDTIQVIFNYCKYYVYLWFVIFLSGTTSILFERSFVLKWKSIFLSRHRQCIPSPFISKIPISAFNGVTDKVLLHAERLNLFYSRFTRVLYDRSRSAEKGKFISSFLIPVHEVWDQTVVCGIGKEMGGESICIMATCSEGSKKESILSVGVIKARNTRAKLTSLEVCTDKRAYIVHRNFKTYPV